MSNLLFPVVTIAAAFSIFALGDVNEVVDSAEWLKAAFAFATSTKGLSAIALVVGAVQIIMMFFKTKLAEFAGKWRLRVVIILTGVGMVLSAVATGESWLGVLVSAPFIALIQVGIYEFTKEEVLKPIALRKANGQQG